MTRAERKYYNNNYETLIISAQPIQVGDHTSVSYTLTKRKKRNEYIVWMRVVVDVDGIKIPSTIKAVVLDAKTEKAALYDAFKRYFKGMTWGFKFGKDHKIAA